MDGRTPSMMPGLDIGELRCWQHFLEAALRLKDTLDRVLMDEYDLTLVDIRLLETLARPPARWVRMRDLAEEVMVSPSRISRRIQRLESDGLVRRLASPVDGRCVLVAITDQGSRAVQEAMTTYGRVVRTHFLGQLSRPQVSAMGENCRRINATLRSTGGG